MIKVVLIDDEKPALRELEYLLKEYKEITVLGSYSNPVTAMKIIEQEKPQAVFLDINMPQIMGTELAVKIKEESPATELIFTTAFAQYAVLAFEIQAIDYLLKPISTARLALTLRRLSEKFSDSNQTKRLQIRSLGSFQIGWMDQEPLKWRAQKNKELFAFLLHHYKRSISKDEVIDCLWPEDDPQRAIRQLYNGIYYIRMTLENYGIDKSLIAIDHNYQIKLGILDWDLGNFYTQYRQLAKHDLAALLEMYELYHGDYLAEEYYPWADFERERLCQMYEQCMIRLSLKYMELQQYEKAEDMLIRAYHKNPFTEKITELLLTLYKITDNRTRAVKHYEDYAKLLFRELGIHPDDKIRRLVIL